MEMIHGLLLLIAGSNAFLFDDLKTGTLQCITRMTNLAPSCPFSTLFDEITKIRQELDSTKVKNVQLENRLQALQYTVATENRTLAFQQREIDYLSVRLAGTEDHVGRVEVYQRGRWGPICDSSWDNTDATVLCKMIGYNTGYTGPSTVATKPYLLSNMACSGNEVSLFDCIHTKLSPANTFCLNDKAAVAKCDIGIRISGATDDDRGRVEVLYLGEWGVLCDSSWDNRDATVACKMLGFQRGGVAVTSGVFGQGNGRVIFNNFNCTGNEASLLDCPHSKFGNIDCSQANNAGVICT